MQYKVIYMPWIAAQLREQGFKLLKTGVNPHKPQFDTYIFEETPEFLKAFDEVLTNWK